MICLIWCVTPPPSNRLEDCRDVILFRQNKRTWIKVGGRTQWTILRKSRHTKWTGWVTQRSLFETKFCWLWLGWLEEIWQNWLSSCKTWSNSQTKGNKTSNQQCSPMDRGIFHSHMWNHFSDRSVADSIKDLLCKKIATEVFAQKTSCTNLGNVLVRNVYSQGNSKEYPVTWSGLIRFTGECAQISNRPCKSSCFPSPRVLISTCWIYHAINNLRSTCGEGWEIGEGTKKQ